MGAAAKPNPDEATQDSRAVTEAEIDAVFEEAGGDPRVAVRMLLEDLETMARDGDAATSRGFLKGKFSEGRRRLPSVEDV